MWLLIGHVAVSMCGSLQSMDGDLPEEAHGPAAPGCDFCCTLGEGAWMRALHARQQAMQLPGLQQGVTSEPASLVGRDLAGGLGLCPTVPVQPWGHAGEPFGTMEVLSGPAVSCSLGVC